MRIFIWHGYLLAGTGSNVFARELARQWGRAGHDVTVFSQEPSPGDYDLGGAATVRPDVGGLLPVFVLDRYEGYACQRVQEPSRAELDAWVEANAAAIREHLPADVVVAGHLILGGAGRRGDGCALHGSRRTGRSSSTRCAGTPSCRRGAPRPPPARPRSSSAPSTSAASCEEVCGPLERVHERAARGRHRRLAARRAGRDALAALLNEARRDPPNPGNADERLPDESNAERLAEFLAEDVPTVVYFGKLIENKGVQVLISALREIGCRAVIVGFGPEREQFERQAEGLPVLFTGPFEHRHLIHLCALADAAVVPSIFPEAFGMVAAEAAAAGCPPVVARHSGLASVAEGLERFYPAGKGRLASFPNGDAAELAERLRAILALSGAERDELRAAARAAVVELWSWKSVADRILAASVAPEA